MKNRSILALFITVATLMISCNDSSYDDYREAYIGTYDCIKSNKSFEDEVFSTEIIVEVVIDTSSENMILINDVLIPINEDGTFGLDQFNGDYYDLSIKDGNLRLEVNVYFPFGLALPCYLKGTKQE